MRKKYCFTLLEIMIVIFLIGIIGSIIGYNMTGTLDKGRAFKTTQAQQRLRDLLEYQLADGVASKEDIISNPEQVIKSLDIVKNPRELTKDGWGNPFRIEVNDNEVTVISEKLKQYNAKKGIKDSEE